MIYNTRRVLQQDDAPCHTSRQKMVHLEEQNISVIREGLWDVLERKVSEKKCPRGINCGKWPWKPLIVFLTKLYELFMIACHEELLRF